MTSTPEPETATRTTKGERTKARILDASLELFLDLGFEKTTMRKVAERADVSVGNAYYYFESKEHLVQGFYARTDEEHQLACAPILARETSFKKRLEAVLLAKLDTAEPYHHFSGLLFKTAADPASPLNPFSAESQPVRNQSVELMRVVIEGSDVKPHQDLADDLPDLLWLYMMGVILFWIHDTSPGRARTRRLVAHTTGLVTQLIRLSGLPLMGPLRRRAKRLLVDLRADPDEDFAADASDGVISDLDDATLDQDER
jgi:AcrR family transcriptional regulator